MLSWLKRLCITTNILVAIWFLLDMTGLTIGTFTLVDSAWNSIDGPWFLAYLAIFALFILKERFGKYLLTVFLAIWLIVQFMSHWFYTIFGASDARITSYNRFFADKWHVIPASDQTIIPDFYHIVLHTLLLVAFVCILIYCIKTVREARAKKQNSSTE